MTYFNVLNINIEGDVKDPTSQMGYGEQILRISNFGLERFTAKDTHVTISVQYERIISGVHNVNLKVTTIWLMVDLNRNEADKELSFMKTLIVRSVSHLFGVIAQKYFENKWLIMLPHNEPDYKEPFEIAGAALSKFFKEK